MASAKFAGFDTWTQGTWLGRYGKLGYYKLEGAGPSLVSSPPAGMAIATNASVYSWASATSSPASLQRADGSTRDSDTWYSDGASATFTITPSDATRRRLSVYFLDGDNSGRSQSVTLADAATGSILDTRQIPAFAAGVWLSWEISGSVTLATAGPVVPVVAAFFFDPTPRRPRTTLAAALAAANAGGGGTPANAAGVAPNLSLGGPPGAATGAANAGGAGPSLALGTPPGGATGTAAANASGAAPGLTLAPPQGNGVIAATLDQAIGDAIATVPGLTAVYLQEVPGRDAAGNPPVRPYAIVNFLTETPTWNVAGVDYQASAAYQVTINAADDAIGRSLRDQAYRLFTPLRAGTAPANAPLAFADGAMPPYGVLPGTKVQWKRAGKAGSGQGEWLYGFTVTFLVTRSL